MRRSLWFPLAVTLDLGLAALGLLLTVGLAVFIYPRLYVALAEQEAALPALAVWGVHLAHLLAGWWWGIALLALALLLLTPLLVPRERRADLRAFLASLLALLSVGLGWVMLLGALAAAMLLAGLL